MRNDTLPSPGKLSMGIALQSNMAKAISAVEIASSFNAGKTSMAKQLDTFLVACRTAISGFIDAVVPTVLNRTVGTVPSAPGTSIGQVVRIRCSKGLDRGFVPAPSAFTLANPAKTISAVAIDGPDILLTVTVPYVSTDAAPTVAYAMPGPSTNARDESGNYLAAWAAGAGTITNTVPA